MLGCVARYEQLYPADEGTMILRNIGNNLPTHTT